MRGTVLHKRDNSSCFVDDQVVVGRKHVCALCVEKKNKWQQTPCVPPLGLPCFPQFRWSHFQLLPVLQTQVLLQAVTGCLSGGASFLFTSYEQGFGSTVPNCTPCVGLDFSPFPPGCLNFPHASVARQSIYSCIDSLHIQIFLLVFCRIQSLLLFFTPKSPFLEADSHLLGPPSPDPSRICSAKTGSCAPPGDHKPSPVP